MKRNARLIISIITTIIAVAVIVLSIYFLNKKPTAKYDGMITVEIKDNSGVVIEKDINFLTGDKLLDLLDENFILDYEDSEYGAFIKSIETLIPDEAKHEFILIEVNGKSSELGLTQIELVDGLIITFSISIW